MAGPGFAGGAYWWVNQGQTYRAEREGGYLWAPKRARNGSQLKHWESMLNVHPGDLILHYANSAVQALSVASTTALDTRRPADLPDDLWDAEGRMVRTTYVDATAPVSLAEISLEERRDVPGGPFQVQGAVKQGYLFPLSRGFGEYFQAAFGTRFPIGGAASAPYIPAEATSGATDLLRRLTGISLRTLTGRTNTILGVHPPTVIVATDRSPDGQPVPIAWVDEALARLLRDGSVEVDPRELSYRSSFIAAVLLTLPGAKAIGTQPRITFSPASPPDEPVLEGNPLTFQGDLDRDATGTSRGEQGPLRKALLGSATEAQCALCGELYPVRFLWTAHIKKRAACTDDELRDLQHVAMLACLFGCDALYEAGYVGVVDDGTIIVSKNAKPDTGIAKRLAELDGRRVMAHTSASAAYFAWHRFNTFDGPLGDGRGSG